MKIQRNLSNLFLLTLLLAPLGCQRTNGAARPRVVRQAPPPAASPAPPVAAPVGAAPWLQLGTAFAVQTGLPNILSQDVLTAGAAGVAAWWPLPGLAPAGESCGPAPAGPAPGPTPPWPSVPPPVPPAPGDNTAAAALEDAVLAATNRHRAAGATCGGRFYPPVRPLASQPQLRAAARGHSRDMAVRDYFDHMTPEGAGPGERARAAGFHSSSVAENIAMGQESAEGVVQGWMESTGHCVNIMDPSSTLIGVGYFRQSEDAMPLWTQKFGS